MSANTTDLFAANVKAVESIGRRAAGLERDTDTIAAAVIESAGADYNWTARGAKPAAVHLFVCGAVKGDAVPVQKKEDGTVTNYGRGVNTLVVAIGRALATESDDDSAPVMRVSLKGAGSAAVPTDHPAYPLLLALLGADTDGEATDSE